MKPPSKSPFVVRVPHLIAVIFIVLAAGTADARPKKKNKQGDKGGGKSTPAEKSDKGDRSEKKGDGKPVKPPTLDFTGLQFEGTIHTPQLLYFLDRASQELERASLERRSFIAEMVKSVDEDDL